MSFAVSGPVTGDLRVDSRLQAGGLDLAAGGTVQLFSGQGASAVLQVRTRADLRKLRTRGAAEALPVALSGQLSLAKASAQIEEFSGTIAGAPLRGKLGLVFGPPLQINGEIDAEAVDAGALLATAIGLPAAAAANSWSAEPFAPGLLGDLGGRVGFKVARAALTPSLTARNARGVLRLGRAEIALDEIEAELAGGQLSGALEFRSVADELTARGRLTLKAADAAAIIPAAARPPIAGRLAVQLDAEGTGRSPAALFGSLAGGGTVTLADAQLIGLDSKAFDVAIRAADQGQSIDAQRIRDLIGAAFDGGRLRVSNIDGAISIRAGQARLGQTIAPAEGADLSLAGHVDLSENVLDARITLSGMKVVAGGGRPEIFVALKGPVPAARRTIDVSALVAWLTLRAIDQQASRLQAIESSRQSAPEAPVTAPAARPESAPPPAPEPDDSRTSSVPPSAPVLPPAIEIRPGPAPRRPTLRESGPIAPELRPRPRVPAPPRANPPLDLLFRPEN